MIKCLFFHCLRPDVSLADFTPHYLSRTGRLLAAADGRLQGLVKHLQAPAVHFPEGRTTRSDVCQAMSAAWFNRLSDLDAIMQSPAFEEVAAEATPYVSAVYGYLVEEKVHWLPPRRTGEQTSGFKVVVLARRRPGLSRAAFERHYADRHAPLVRQHHPAVVGYVQNFVREALTEKAPAYDAVVEMWLESDTALQERFYATPESAVIIRDDVARFLDTESLVAMAFYERVDRLP